jgi:hypothetical protein
MKLWFSLPPLCLSISVLLFGPALLPETGGREQYLCDYVLVPQFDPGGCVSTGDPSCNGSGVPCCGHFHYSLGWNKAVHWIKPTGQMKGPSIKKYYSGGTGTCLEDECVSSVPATDFQHFVWEDTLVGCPF